MRPNQALSAIQTIADHSQKWHEGTTSRNISSNSNNDELAATVRPHLNKECPINEEVKQLEDVKYGEFGRSVPFNESIEAKFRVDASVNVIPRNTFEYLRLANLRNTNMLIEMADMMKKAPLEVDINTLTMKQYMALSRENQASSVVKP
nr:hypothetical protein [Tanacetum cinerariifolium]